jgi:Putative Flp pilus-assembly TadE/G-like
MTRFANQRGQSMVLTLVFMTALMAMATAVLDVGSWYRTHRHTQATADAAALAAAQELPDFPADAVTSAVDYADRNGGGVGAEDVEFPAGTVEANDTVKVTARKNAPGFLSRLFGIDSLTARASATARVGALGSAKWAAPIGVDYRHEFLGCNAALECNPRFDEPTELTFDKVGPGAFRLLNIDGSRGGTGPAVIGDWIRTGLDGSMPRNEWYYSDPGIKPNSSHIKGALESRFGDHKEILIPIYSDTREQGASFDYYVVGWVGWVVTDYQIRGVNEATVYGHFTRVIWDGIQSESASDESFGARTVELIE